MTTENGRTVIRISAPFTERGEVKLQQAGEELLVQVGEQGALSCFLRGLPDAARPRPLSRTRPWRSSSRIRMQPKSEQNELQPGADRFWGEFSRSQAGRSTVVKTA